jgi:DNA polymerase-4
MDAFYASVEVLDAPGLAGKPVIVGGGGSRGVVSAASYAARRFGVRSAMPMYQARRLCPGGIYLPVRMERYQEVSREVMQTLLGFTPVVEPVSVDEAYLDLTGTEALWGPPRETGRAIKEAVRRRTGLTCSVGLAPRRYLCKIASDRDKPDGLTVVEDVEAFLQTISLAEVPGVGAKAQARLRQMGVGRLVEVRSLGRRRLEQAFGAWGRRLWELAHGVDNTPVGAGGERKSISHEITLAADTADREVLAAHLLDLSQRLCRRVRGKGLCGRVVVLKLRHADHRLVTRRASLDQPTDRTDQVFAAARELLAGYGPAGPFRLVGVGLSGLSPGDSGQAGLFGREDALRRRSLSVAEDAIVGRFGEEAISRAGALDRRGQSRVGRGAGEDKKKEED